MHDLKNNVDCLDDLFPAVLKNKLLRKELTFPEGISYHYDKIKAYRCIRRNKDDFTPVGREDFRSNIEVSMSDGVVIKKKRGQKIDSNDISYYGTSLFQDRSKLKNAMKLPRPSQKICVGYVYEEGGPQLTNEGNGHINWWLYENVDLSNFVIEEETEKDINFSNIDIVEEI